MKTAFAIAVYGALLNALAALAGRMNTSPYDVSASMQTVLIGNNLTRHTTYPTDITRNIMPVKTPVFSLGIL